VLDCLLLDHTDLSTLDDLEMVCPPTEPKCASIVAFTDGSGGLWPGYGAVLCLASQWTQPDFAFDPANCVRINGGSARAGGSYSAEMTGIIVALGSVPLNCDLLIPTDCESAIPVVMGLLMSTTRRQRLGSRAQVLTCRNLLELRRCAGGKTTFKHVPSHTELLDFLSYDNAATYVEAGEAAKTEAFDEARDTPFTANEKWAVFWDTDTSGPDRHVSGDLRKLLVSRARRSVLIRL
jgi:hypothetical protein